MTIHQLKYLLNFGLNVQNNMIEVHRLLLNKKESQKQLLLVCYL